MYLDLLLYLLDARRRGRWAPPVSMVAWRGRAMPFTTPSGAWVCTPYGWAPANPTQPVLP